MKKLERSEVNTTAMLPTTPIMKELQKIKLEPNETEAKIVGVRIIKEVSEALQVTTSEYPYKYYPDFQGLLAVLSNRYDAERKNYDEPIEINLKTLVNLMDGKSHFSEVRPKRMKEVLIELSTWNSVQIEIDSTELKESFLKGNKAHKERGERMLASYRGSLVPNDVVQINANSDPIVTFYRFPALMQHAIDTGYIETVPFETLDITKRIGATGEKEPSGLHSTAIEKEINLYLLTNSIRSLNSGKKLPYVLINFDTILKHLKDCNLPTPAKSTRFEKYVIEILDILKTKQQIKGYEIISKSRRKNYQIRIY